MIEPPIEERLNEDELSAFFGGISEVVRVVRVADYTAGLSVVIEVAPATGEVVGLRIRPMHTGGGHRIRDLITTMGLTVLPVGLHVGDGTPADVPPSTAGPSSHTASGTRDVVDDGPPPGVGAGDTELRPAPAPTSPPDDEVEVPSFPDTKFEPPTPEPERAASNGAASESATKRTYHKKPPAKDLKAAIRKLGDRLSAKTFALYFDVPENTAGRWLRECRADGLV